MEQKHSGTVAHPSSERTVANPTKLFPTEHLQTLSPETLEVGFYSNQNEMKDALQRWSAFATSKKDEPGYEGICEDLLAFGQMMPLVFLFTGFDVLRFAGFAASKHTFSAKFCWIPSNKHQ